MKTLLKVQTSFELPKADEQYAEMRKLKKYLEEHNIPHSVMDRGFFPTDDGKAFWASKNIPNSAEHLMFSPKDGYQIIVWRDAAPTDTREWDNPRLRAWDAICGCGSYGNEEGLLEVMGNPVILPSDGDTVAGWLTADDVIARLEGERDERQDDTGFADVTGYAVEAENLDDADKDS